MAFVLRLRSEALARGAVVGELEDVDTGARHVLCSADDLLALLAVPRASADASPEPDAPVGRPPGSPP